MGKFEVGQKVVVIAEERHGQVGTINDTQRLWDYEVAFTDGAYLGYDADELALVTEAPAEPATPAAATAGDTGAGVSEPSAFDLFAKAQNSGNYEDMRAAMFALKVELGESQRAEASYVKRIEGLHLDVSVLRQQLAAAESLVSKRDTQIKIHKHSVELHEEQYHQAKDNATLLYRALREHAPADVLETVKGQLNGSTNEYDELMSDATRGRETEAKLAAAESALAAARGERDTLQSEAKLVHRQLGNMLFNLKQQPDMKRVTDSLESIMDSVGWDKS